MDYCIWIYNKAGQYYTTSCCNQEIDEHDYIGKYCTCCGKKIVVPILESAERDTLQGGLAYAN